MQLDPEVLSLLKLLKTRKYTKHIKCTQFLSLLLSIIFVSCTSYKVQHEYIDYDNSSIVSYQIKKASKLLDKGKSTEALFLAELLRMNIKENSEIENLRTKAIKLTQKNFHKSIKEEKWTEAISYFRNLTTIGEKPKDWTEGKILKMQEVLWRKKRLEALIKLNDKTYKNKNYPKNFEEMLKGTVTVWVDRGTKIERGIGFSDVVIGSGFFIDSKGYFITNYHVIQSEVDPNYNGYSRLYIKSPKNSNIKIPAKVIGWDPLFDLALVKTELSPEIIFPLGSSKSLKVGSKIYAIGSPAGLEKTLTSGIVSTKYRRLYSLVDVMQIDAPINHGNSGGPIVNEKGLVQGIAFAGLERNEGLNFAIPVEHLKRNLARFYAGGKIEHSWLGAYGKKVKIKENEFGVEVSYILPSSFLEISGLKENSIITEFNGVRVKSTEEIQAELLTLYENTIVKMKGYERLKSNDLVKKEWLVLCSKRPSLPGNEVLKKDSLYRAMLPIFGLHLEASGKRKTYRVVEVDPGSFSDESGFTKNDYIEINGKNKFGENEEIVQVHIYAKKVKTGYVDSFMIISAYLDNSLFF